jgi:hypothetical protein
LQKTLGEIIILQDFLENQDATNPSPSQEDPYFSPSKDFKLSACSVYESRWSKVELTNTDAAVAAVAVVAAVAN